MEETLSDTWDEVWESYVNLQQSLKKHLRPDEETGEADQQKMNVFNCLKSDARSGRFHAKHLQPLSIYSRVVSCDNKASLRHSTNFTSPFINFKIDLVSLSLAKGNIDDSGLDDDSGDTPAKQPRSPKVHSPDLGSIVDLISPAATSTPEPSEATEGIRSSCKDAVESHFRWGREENGPSEESGDPEQSIAPHTVTSNKWDSPAFNCEVDEHFSLKASGSGSAGGRPNAVVQDKLILCDAGSARGEEDAGGSFTLSYQKGLKTGNGASQPGDAEVPLVTSRPLHRTASTEMPRNELRPFVKPVVRDPNHQASRSEAAAEPAESIGDGVRRRKQHWEREKRLYMDSVTRHLNEDSAAGDGAMTEMLNLMADVTHREYAGPGRRWQHPSDLTRSNYQRRCGHQGREMSLHEWWTQNGPAVKRFANMPKIFKRSPIP